MIEAINLNIIPNGVNPVCHVSQYDTGRQIKINLFEGNNPYIIPSGASFTLNVRKPDNTIVTQSVSGTQGDTFLNITTTQQMTACVGENLCELKLTISTLVVGTLNFIMQVERDVLADGIPSQSEIHDLNELVDAAAAEIIEREYDSNAVIFDDTPTADHGTGYTVTSEGIKTALDDKANTSDLAPVATSGNYNDLSNTPDYNSKMDKYNPTGTGAFSLNRAENTPIGAYSTAEGLGATASGYYSHAEGYATEAGGAMSHAEGNITKALGNNSHAEGEGTKAQRKSNHTFGEYNIADTGGANPSVKGTYIEIVGNGTSDESRSNARTLDWSGNEVLAGGLKVNGNKDVATTDQLVNVNSFTNDITTTADGLAAITLPSGVAINNCMSVVVQNLSGAYLYAFLIKQPSVLWVNVRQYNGAAYASQDCTVRVFYYY